MLTPDVAPKAEEASGQPQVMANAAAAVGAEVQAPAPQQDPRTQHEEIAEGGSTLGCETAIALCAVGLLEGAALAMLPAMYQALASDFGIASLNELATANTCQLVLSCIAAPFWGCLASQGVLRRRSILLIALLGLGISMNVVALVGGTACLTCMHAIKGVFLAALRPISNSVVGDSAAANRRGRFFGAIQASSLVGSLTSSWAVEEIASNPTIQIFGQQGWRAAHAYDGLACFVVAAVVAAALREPKADGTAAGAGNCCQAGRVEFANILMFFQKPTFWLTLAADVFDRLPWIAWGYIFIYWEWSGVSDSDRKVLAKMVTVGAIFGSVVAGLLSDFLSRAKPVISQLSSSLGVLFALLTFFSPPGEEKGYHAFLILTLSIGLFACWTQSGVVVPVLADIVETPGRARIMAWESSLATAIVKLVQSEWLLGYVSASYVSSGSGVGWSSGSNPASAEEFGQRLGLVSCLPWIACLLASSFLLRTYRRDRRQRELAQRPQEVAQLGARADQGVYV